MGIREIQETSPEELFEDEYEDEYEEPVREVADEDDEEYEYDEVDEVLAINSKTGEREFQAIERIEQANLYLTLLNHSLFSPGSARDEIIASVENEIKDFILERLETLLGIKQPKAVAEPASELFSPEQMAALTGIANRLIDSKKPAQVSAQPQVRPVQARATKQPIVQQPVAQRPAAPQPKPEKPVTQKRKVRRKKKKKNVLVIKAPTEEEGNKGSDGKDYSQAVGTTIKPQPMPSQQMQNSINQQSVNASQGARDSGEAGQLGTLLNAAIALAQQKNANVREDNE